MPRALTATAIVLMKRAILAVAVLIAIATMLPCAAMADATLTSDKPDYHPGETVTLYGTGFQPGEAVTMVLVDTPANHDPVYLTAVADDAGNFTNSSYVVQESDLGVTFTVTATGDMGSMAQTTFTDAISLVSVSAGAQSPNPVVAGNPATYVVSVVANSTSFLGGSCTAALSVTTTLPAGATALFNPTPVSFNWGFLSTGQQTQTSTLTIATTSATPGGTFSFTIQATGCNGTQTTTSPTLVVSAPAGGRRKGQAIVAMLSPKDWRFIPATAGGK